MADTEPVRRELGAILQDLEDLVREADMDWHADVIKSAKDLLPIDRDRAASILLSAWAGQGSISDLVLYGHLYEDCPNLYYRSNRKLANLLLEIIRTLHSYGYASYGMVETERFFQMAASASAEEESATKDACDSPAGARYIVDTTPVPGDVKGILEELEEHLHGPNWKRHAAHLVMRHAADVVRKTRILLETDYHGGMSEAAGAGFWQGGVADLSAFWEGYRDTFEGRRRMCGRVAHLLVELIAMLRAEGYTSAAMDERAKYLEKKARGG